MSQPFSFFPSNLITFKSKNLTTINFEMSNDRGLVKIRIFFKNKFKRYVLIIFGILWENMLNV